MTGPRLGIAASAAAVFVVAVIGSVQLLTTGVNDVAQDATERVADQPMGSIIDEEAALSADADTGAAEAAEEGTFVARPAPPYVSYEGFVYTVGTETNIAPDGTTVGQVTTARDVAGDVPRAWNVYEDASGTLHMEGSIPGLFSRLTPVTRVYAGQTYGLVSDSPITEFGRWPTLPTAVPEPSSIDGSPGLIQAGTDARGAPIFVRIGGSPADGFAVPPDQTAPDAAGGNPNWTWWEPYSE